LQHHPRHPGPPWASGAAKTFSHKNRRYPLAEEGQPSLGCSAPDPSCMGHRRFVCETFGIDIVQRIIENIRVSVPRLRVFIGRPRTVGIGGHETSKDEGVEAGTEVVELDSESRSLPVNLCVKSACWTDESYIYVSASYVLVRHAGAPPARIVSERRRGRIWIGNRTS
jgi:hypothetical protein